jgi:hypothetical protein
MTLETAIALLARADLEESIATLCVIASIAHVVGDNARREDAVNLAAEMAAGLASDEA